LSQLKERRQQAASEQIIAEVNAGGKISYEPETGRATVLDSVKFEKRSFAAGKVDKPTAVLQDPEAAQATVDDLLKLHQAQPGPITVTKVRPRLNKTIKEPKSRVCFETWVDRLCKSQGECLKALLVRCGVPEDMVCVATEVSQAISAEGRLYIDFTRSGLDDACKAKHDNDLKFFRDIEKRGNVKWDKKLESLRVLRPFGWSEKCWSASNEDSPNAALRGADFEDIVHDMAEVYKYFRVPVFLRFNPTKFITGANAERDMWYARLSYNRGFAVKAALVECGVPCGKLRMEHMLKDGTVRADSDEALDAGQRLSLRKLLLQYATSTNVEDIRKLQDLCELARVAKRDPTKERLDHLIAQAEETLQKLQHLRRRKEARATYHPRDVASSRITSPKSHCESCSPLVAMVR